jgi:hypothetical protein
MELPGGVQEARPDANGGGAPRCITQGEAQLGERCGALRSAGDIRLNADVAACAESIELTSDEPFRVVGECCWQCVVNP